ncbi:hypothetical protein GQ607_007437 [Colletotrichum asianum]|uniref:Uncharacterized protein n=1 Tax=Colletotrichum asianum TaxID=702518 RepID=A0A8H3ZN28_9PEZI|nr:hypothetical protein GQ607_007437 [Colletotrichum asianum]
MAYGSTSGLVNRNGPGSAASSIVESIVKPAEATGGKAKCFETVWLEGAKRTQQAAQDDGNRGAMLPSPRLMLPRVADADMLLASTQDEDAPNTSSCTTKSPQGQPQSQSNIAIETAFPPHQRIHMKVRRGAVILLR